MWGAQPLMQLLIASSDREATSSWRHLVNHCLEGGQVKHPLQERHAPAGRH
jgi:hypothetical protein